MRLRFRLALSYLLVIALFLVMMAAVWLLFGGRRAVGQVHREAISLAMGLVRETEAVRSQQGWDGASQLLRGVVLPIGSTLQLFRTQAGPAECLQGQESWQDSECLRQAFQGEVAESMVTSVWPEKRRYRLWLPVGRRPVQGVLALSVPVAPSPELRAIVAEALIPAVGAAALAAFLAGLALSSLIAGPVSRLARATEALGQEDLSHRVTVTGRGEMAELARSFNRMAANLEDSRERLRQEKSRAEQLEASRREFLADVSHNLKTPLAAIQGWTEALLDDLVPGAEKETLQRIRRETGFVAQTVQRLLDLTRWDSAEPLMSWEEFPLSEPLMDAVDSLAEAAEAQGISLGFSGVEAGLKVRADRGKLREIFQIFLENAVQHAGPGTHLEVRVKPGQRLQVELEDNGSGIDLAALGDPRSRYRGGLGLAIAHKLVEAHGGGLEITSTPGQGTRIRFDLPGL